MARLLFEGTKYDKKAIKELSDSGLYDEETSKKIVDALFTEDIPAFHGSGHAWLDKYIVGIIKMLIKYANGDPNKAYEFLSGCGPVFDEYLSLVKTYRDKWGAQQTDDKFNNKMTYQDVKDELEKIKEEIDKASDERLKGMQFNESNYVLIPIDSYEEMHSKFGGRATGDGSSDLWAGGGGTAWCHTNAKNVYDSWVDDGKFKFFVLANKNWEDIPFNAESNSENYKDAYGNSLIAILAKTKNGILVHNTLRCNHVWEGHKGVPDADNVYKDYSELSEVAGFNVKDKILDNLGVDPSKVVSNSIFEYKDEVKYDISDIKEEIEKVIITEGCTKIHSEVFMGCPNLKEIEFRNTGELTIGEYAFYNCHSLERVVFPSTIKEIRDCAFSKCTRLVDITISDGVKSIGSWAFSYCESLESVYLPESVKTVSEYAFSFCPNMLSVVAEDGALSALVGSGIFSGSNKLEYVYLPKSTSIHSDTLGGMGENTIVKTSSRFVRYYCETWKQPYETVDIPDNGDTFIFNGIPAYMYLSKEEQDEVKYGVFPDGLSTVPQNAFAGLKNMISVNGLGRFGIVNIDTGAFFDCESLSTISIPRSLRRVGNNAFAGCLSLTYFEFPEGFDGVISNDCFSGCYKLHEVAILSDKIKTIQPGAFANTAIRIMKLPNGVEELKSHVFDDCAQLEYVSIPETLKYISVYTFEDCDNLKKIWCRNRVAYSKLKRIQEEALIPLETEIELVGEDNND